MVYEPVSREAYKRMLIAEWFGMALWAGRVVFNDEYYACAICGKIPKVSKTKSALDGFIKSSLQRHAYQCEMKKLKTIYGVIEQIELQEFLDAIPKQA